MGIGLLFLMTSFFTTKDLNDVIKKEVLHQIEQTPISQFIDSTDKFNYSYLVKKWEAKQRMGFLNSINKETLNGSFILYEEIRFTQPQCFSSNKSQDYKAYFNDGNKVLKSNKKGRDLGFDLAQHFEKLNQIEIDLFPKTNYSIANLIFKKDNLVVVKTKVNVKV